MSRRIALALLALAAPGLAGAQQHQPYAGEETRAVKALSEKEVADLKAGRGMGLALAAELNGYPGPLHVLEHAEALALTPAQHERVRALYEAMKAEAVELGERLIEEERRLDRLFADRSVTPESLEAATAAIGRTQAQLRAAHLRHHLLTDEVLTPEQARRYAELRGYAGEASATHQGHGGGHSGAH